MSHMVTHMSQKARSNSEADRKAAEQAQQSSRGYTYAAPSDAAHYRKQRANSSGRKAQGLVFDNQKVMSLSSAESETRRRTLGAMPEQEVMSSGDMLQYDVGMEHGEIAYDKSSMANALARLSQSGRYGLQTVPQFCCTVTPVAVVSPVTLTSSASTVEETTQAATLGTATSTLSELVTHLSRAVVQCHVMAGGYVVVTSNETPTTLQIFKYEDSTGHLEVCPLVTELACDSPIHCLLCLDSHFALSKSWQTKSSSNNNMMSLMLAATEAGRLYSWKLEFPPARDARNDDVNGFQAHSANQFPLHLPNPIIAIAASRDGRHLATGCCFSKYDILAGGKVSRSARGTVKTWDLSTIVQCSLNNKTSRIQEVVHKCLKTFQQISRCITTGNSRDAVEPLGIGALSYSPDSRLLAVGFTRPVDVQSEWTAATTTSPTLVLCCAETLNTLWAIDEPIGWCVGGLAFTSSRSNTKSNDCAGDEWIESTHHLFVSTTNNTRKVTVTSRYKSQPSDINSDPPSSKCFQLVQVADNWRKEFDYYSTQIGLAVSEIGWIVISRHGSQLVALNFETGDEIDTIAHCSDLNGIGSLNGIGLSQDGKIVVRASSSRHSTIVCAFTVISME